MEIVDTAQINSFASVARQADAQPSEEPIFVLTGSQLQDIITHGVHEATKGLNSRVNTLEDTITRQAEKIKNLEATQDLQAENSFIQLKLINKLMHKGPGQIEIARATKIEAYLLARLDHRATFESLKGHLQVGNDQLNRAIKQLVSSGKCTITRTPGNDKRKRTLVLVPTLSEK